MNLLQILSAALFFIVFIQLFIALSIYLWRVLLDYFKSGKEAKKPAKPLPQSENDNSVKLHISEGLIEVNRLPDHEQEPL